MRLVHRALSGGELKQFNAELKRAAHIATVKSRVCGSHCSMVCPSCGSTKCQCQCSPHCSRAPLALSTEPDLYPIEPSVLPLVYEMKRVGLFEPCWSCEGHLSEDGRIWKLPSLWFYSQSMVHIRLFASALASLRFSGRLSTPWKVAVSHSDESNPRSTFALEPVPASDTTLDALHVDLGEIAKSLQYTMEREAERLRDGLKR